MVLKKSRSYWNPVVSFRQLINVLRIKHVKLVLWNRCGIGDKNAYEPHCWVFCVTKTYLRFHISTWTTKLTVLIIMTTLFGETKATTKNECPSFSPVQVPQVKKIYIVKLESVIRNVPYSSKKTENSSRKTRNFGNTTSLLLLPRN